MARKYEEVNDTGAAIVCDHVALQGLPILLAVRDEPSRPEDSGWQFLCNSGTDETDAKVWAISEVLDLEPSLSGLLDEAPGTELIRKNVKSQWRITRK
jgi:hypothetical protein